LAGDDKNSSETGNEHNRSTEAGSHIPLTFDTGQKLLAHQRNGGGNPANSCKNSEEITEGSPPRIESIEAEKRGQDS